MDIEITDRAATILANELFACLEGGTFNDQPDMIDALEQLHKAFGEWPHFTIKVKS